MFNIVVHIYGPLKALYTSSPDRPVHSNSTSPGSILATQQLRAKTIHSHLHRCRNVCKGGFEPGLSRLRVRAQNTRRHAAFCRAAAVTCHEALKMCGRCAARLAAMPGLSKYFEMGGKVTTNHNIYFHFYMHDASVPPKFVCKS